MLLFNVLDFYAAEMCTLRQCTLSNIWLSIVTASLLAQRQNAIALTLLNQTSLHSTYLLHGAESFLRS